MSADFGTVTVNNTSGAQTFTVTNGGQAESGTISAIVSGTNAADFTVQNGCTTLAGAGTCVVSVTFHPTSSGAKTGTLVVTGSPGGTAMATLNAAAVNAPSLTITGTPFDFGNVVTGQTSASGHVYTVTNGGGVTTGTLTVTPAGSNPGQFTKSADTCNGQTLSAGASCTFTVNFAPTSVGAKSASFDVTGNPGGAVSGVATGTGINPALIVVTPNATDFGQVTVGQQSTQSSFVVTNSGGVATGALSAPALTGAQAASFSIVSQNCTGVVLQPAGANSCTVIARFNPSAAGTANANLNVAGTPGGTGTANLSGTGQSVGSLVFNPTTFTFAQTNVGAASAAQQFTLSNPGGSAIGPLVLATGGTNANQFQIVAGTDTCTGQTLNPTVGTCTVSVTFNPTSAGTKNGTLTATAPSGTFSASLSGTAIQGPQLSINPVSKDYGSVAIQTNSPYQDFVVTNTGGLATGVPTVTLTGTNASEFNIANPPNGGCTAAIAPGASCTIQVRFSPVIVSMIAKSASLNVAASPGGNVSAALSGFAITDAQIANNPSALNFGQVLLGNTSTQNVTVTNGGAATTGTLAVTITGANAADYTQTNNCTTLLNSQSCTVMVTFAPQNPYNPVGGTDTRNATLTVTGMPGGTSTTSLTGTTKPRLEITAPTTNPFDFGTVRINGPETAVCQTFTVTNNTAATASLAQTTNFGTPQQFYPVDVNAACQQSGPYPGTVTGACGASLTSGASCSIRLAFNPESTGLKTGNVVFAINGGGANNTVTQQLRGTGGSLAINPCSTPTCTGAPPAVTPANPFSYGTVNVNNSVTQQFYVDNQTGVGTGAMGTRLTGANVNQFHIISDTCAGMTVGTSMGCVITVSFAPTTTGTFTATIVTTDSTGAQVTGSQNLSGTAGTPAVLSVTPNPGNFTAFSGEASTASFTVSSAGGTTSPITITPPASPFYTILGGQMGDCMSGTTTLAAGASCVVRVRYAPTNTCAGTGCTSGNNVSSFTVTATPIGAPGGIVVGLNGTQRSTISITPATTSYSTVDDGTMVTGAYTVTNNSASTIVIPTISTAGATGVGTFAVIMNTCGGMIGPGGMCTFSLQYSSMTAGTIGGFVQVDATTGGLPTGTARSNLTGTVITKANLRVSPPVNRDFGSVTAVTGMSTATFTITNIGQQTSGVPVVTIGTDPVSFMITANTCTAGLAQNATCTVTVTFKPLTATAKTGTLNVAGSTTDVDGPGGVAPGVIPLSGNGLANTAVTITPAQFTFPGRAVGTVSAPQTFTVSNPSGVGVTLNTGGALLNSNQFTIDAASTCGASLGAGATCTYIVRFAPTVVNFNDNRLLTPVAGTSASISGTAVAPLTPGNLAFGNVEITPAPGVTQSLTITNQANNDNTGVLSFAVTGADAALFTIAASSTCPGLDLAAGANCRLDVTFAPTTTGPKTASVTVTGASGIMSSAALTGNGLNHPMVSGAVTGAEPAAQGSRRVGALDTSPTVYQIVNGQGGSNAPTGKLSFALTDTANFKLTTQGVANACDLTGNQVLTTNTNTAPTAPSAGSFCNVGITYSPTTTGAHTTTLNVTDATHASNTLAITNAVTGTGTETLTSPSPIAVGAGTPSTNVAIIFTNNASVAMTGVTVDASMLGTQVSISTDGCTGMTIAAGGGTCTVNVRYVPTGTGFTGASISATGTVSGNNGAPLVAPSGYGVNWSRASTATVMLIP